MFHKEGHKIIILFLGLTIIDIILLEYIWEESLIVTLIQLLLLTLLILLLQFFRNPKRNTKINKKHILSPVDGKVVIVRKVYEKEFFKEERIQVSIFMSPIDVHVTRYPICGKVIFSKYHPGKYLVAWHPKSSEKNERTTIVLKTDNFGNILYRQIAGALARRIVNYAKVDSLVTQGEDAGFIKFGSRVDIFLPLDSKIKIKLNAKVRGGETLIAT
jgi:phosphatidylserine decarboxylase|tara:strand:- start:19804 stop:20451 length:648 start_codon:yes stop_codon:yes gene_type:complete